MSCKRGHALITFALAASWTDAWIPVKCVTIRPRRQGASRPIEVGTWLTQLNESDQKKGFLDVLSPYETKIPPDLKDEIYAAEANTPAAKERGQRVALYILIAFVGIMSAFFNGFMTELRSNGPDGNGVDLAEAGFDWVVGNPVFSFLFLNKIGGGLCLVGGAGAGLLAEAELDTKRINAEKIYEELERRRQAKATKPQKSSTKKKRRPGKEAKRLVALSEVVSASDQDGSSAGPADNFLSEEEGEPPFEARANEEKNKNDGLFGSIKSLYDQADTLAASQALMLNKKLEDAGVIEKITDETGLKVIGKEEASRLVRKKEEGEE